MQTQQFEPRLVHPLPQAPVFLGRDAELAELRRFWLTGSAGVLALVGLGGAGKTALAARFLAELLASGAPRGLFVWSFYQEPDAGLYLRHLHDYLARGAPAPEAESAPSLDRAALLRRVGGNEQLLSDLVRLFRAEGEPLVGEIRGALLDGAPTRWNSKT